MMTSLLWLRTLLDYPNGNGHGWMISINLGNRRVRSVGEMAENQFPMSLVRVERASEKSVVYGEADA